MGNKNANQNRSLLDKQRNDSASGYNQFNTDTTRDYNDAVTQAGGIGKQIQERYGNPAGMLPPGMTPNNKGWFDNPTANSEGGFSQGGGAGFDPNGDFGSARKGYQNFADTGGASDFEEAQGLYRNIASTGGFNADALRNRATAVIPSFYNAYKNSAARRSNVQGGYSPGFDEQQAEMGRQSGREGFNASRQVEGDIADKMQQGAEFGASGLAGVGRTISGNRLAGLGGLTNIGQAGQQNAQFNANLGQQNNQFNAGLNQNNNQFNQSQNQNFQDAMTKLYAQNNQNSARGLQDFYSSSPGAVDSSRRDRLSGLGGLSQSQLQNLALRNGLKGTNWAGIFGSAASAASSLFSGRGNNGNIWGRGGGQSGSDIEGMDPWSGQPFNTDPNKGDPWGNPTPPVINGPPGTLPGTQVPLPQ